MIARRAGRQIEDEDDVADDMEVQAPRRPGPVAVGRRNRRNAAARRRAVRDWAGVADVPLGEYLRRGPDPRDVVDLYEEAAANEWITPQMRTLAEFYGTNLEEYLGRENARRIIQVARAAQRLTEPIAGGFTVPADASQNFSKAMIGLGDMYSAQWRKGMPPIPYPKYNYQNQWGNRMNKRLINAGRAIRTNKPTKEEQTQAARRAIVQETLVRPYFPALQDQLAAPAQMFNKSLTQSNQRKDRQTLLGYTTNRVAPMGDMRNRDYIPGWGMAWDEEKGMWVRANGWKGALPELTKTNAATLRNNNAIMQRSLTPGQIGRFIPPIVRSLVTANDSLVHTGFGPVSKSSFPLYGGRFIDPITNAIRTLPKPSSKYVNPKDLRDVIKYYQARVIAGWNSFVRCQQNLYSLYKSVANGAYIRRLRAKERKFLQPTYLSDASTANAAGLVKRILVGQNPYSLSQAAQQRLLREFNEGNIANFNRVVFNWGTDLYNTLSDQPPERVTGKSLQAVAARDFPTRPQETARNFYEKLDLPHLSRRGDIAQLYEANIKQGLRDAARAGGPRVIRMVGARPDFQAPAEQAPVSEVDDDDDDDDEEPPPVRRRAGRVLRQAVRQGGGMRRQPGVDYRAVLDRFDRAINRRPAAREREAVPAAMVAQNEPMPRPEEIIRQQVVEPPPPALVPGGVGGGGGGEGQRMDDLQAEVREAIRSNQAVSGIAQVPRFRPQDAMSNIRGDSMSNLRNSVEREFGMSSMVPQGYQPLPSPLPGLAGWTKRKILLARDFANHHSMRVILGEAGSRPYPGGAWNRRPYVDYSSPRGTRYRAFNPTVAQYMRKGPQPGEDPDEEIIAD